MWNIKNADIEFNIDFNGNKIYNKIKKSDGRYVP